MSPSEAGSGNKKSLCWYLCRVCLTTAEGSSKKNPAEEEGAACATCDLKGGAILAEQLQTVCNAPAWLHWSNDP